MRTEAPVLTPPPCFYCGSAADVCVDCANFHRYYPKSIPKPVVKDGLCSKHVRSHESHAYAFYGTDVTKYIPQTCSGCRAKNPWRAKDTLELKGFHYERGCLCHPMKSPNGGRFNVVFIPQYRYVKVGEAKSSEEQRAAWAQAAYDKEMAFSGEVERAEAMKKVVLAGEPFADPDLE